MKLNKRLFATSLAFLIISSGNSFAGGYATEMTSTSGLANSYAGSVTGIHDVSDMFFNPATLTNVKDGEFVLSASYKNFSVNPQGASTSTGTTRGNEIHDAGVNTSVPALYVAKHINDTTTFGLAVTSPFGVSTQYSQNWQGKDRANATSVESLNINPTLAYKLCDKLSLGAGLQAQYIQGSFTSVTPAVGGVFSPTKMHGSDWGYGYTLGAQYKVNDDLKLGLGYRSKVDHKLTGTIQVDRRYYSDIRALVVTPESLTAGAAYKLNQDVELAYDVTWTRWSRINGMTMKVYQNDTLNNALQKPKAVRYGDSLMHAVGANFTLNDKWLLRTGAAYERETTTSNRIPVSDKIWTSIGFNYKFTKTFSADATYMHQFYKKASIEMAQTSSTASMNAHYKIAVDVFSVAVRKEF